MTSDPIYDSIYNSCLFRRSKLCRFLFINYSNLVMASVFYPFRPYFKASGGALNVGSPEETIATVAVALVVGYG